MGLLTRWFANDIQKAVAQSLTQINASLLPVVTSSIYNENIFQWIGAGQIIYDWEDTVKLVEEGYQRNADVYTCIDLIIKKGSECAFSLYEIKPGVTKKDLKIYENMCMAEGVQARMKSIQLKKQLFEEVKDAKNPILQLLEKPNPMQNYEEWISDLIGFFLCNGNGYILGNGASEEQVKRKLWTQLYAMPSTYMQIVSGGYLQPILGYKLATTYAEPVAFPADQICHFKTFNPDFTLMGTNLYGQSPLKAVYRNIIKENQGQDELLKQVKNGGAMGFISPDSNDGVGLTKPQLDLLKEKIIAAKGGEELMDRIFPSTGPLKWTQIGLASTDLQLIESLNLDTKKIYAAFHVPITFSGSEEASTDNNVSHHGKQLIYNAVMPVLRKVKDSINSFVCQPYEKASGKKYYFDFDISSYVEMQEDMEKLTKWLAESWWLTPNEKREAQNYDQSGDVLMDNVYAPANIVPIEDLSIDQAFNNAIIKS
jgi:HK97 family phage portal protein